MTNKEYIDLQKSHDLDDRRWNRGHDDIPPIALLYQPFGEFLDIYLNSQTSGLVEAHSPQMRKLVDCFASSMSSMYDTENERRDACLPALNTIFKAALGESYPRLTAAAIGSFRTDGHNLGPKDEPLMIVEIKNDLVGISSNPILELCNYYYRVVEKFAVTSPELFLASKMPALVLTVVGTLLLPSLVLSVSLIVSGPTITFYALAYVGRIHYVSLTSGLSCTDGAVGKHDRQKLYDAFAAASTLLFRILQDATSIATNVPPPLPNRVLPYVMELPPAKGSGNSIKFQITQKIPTTFSRQHYFANSMGSDGKVLRLIVKFSDTYSRDLHLHCADAGHAPVLRGFGRLPGGLFGAAMDILDHAEELKSNGSQDDADSWAGQLSQLVASIHAAGFVHGNLQYDDMVHVDNKVMLLDFEWGGVKGEACYPKTGDALVLELTDGRHQKDLTITEEDDQLILAATLEQIRL